MIGVKANDTGSIMSADLPCGAWLLLAQVLLTDLLRGALRRDVLAAQQRPLPDLIRSIEVVLE